MLRLTWRPSCKLAPVLERTLSILARLRSPHQPARTEIPDQEQLAFERRSLSHRFSYWFRPFTNRNICWCCVGPVYVRAAVTHSRQSWPKNIRSPTTRMTFSLAINRLVSTFRQGVPGILCHSARRSKSVVSGLVWGAHLFRERTLRNRAA